MIGQATDPGINAGQTISVASNTVVLGRTAPLPSTGVDVLAGLRVAGMLIACGGALLLAGRRRRHAR